MKMNELEKGQKQFQEKQMQENKAYFENLSKGQSPSFYVLSCCDSRTSPTTITGQPLGQLFIHRNIANQAKASDDSFKASLYYAIHVLKVDYILVLGHTNCGGVQATKSEKFAPELESWIHHVRESVSSYDGEVPDDAESLERHNVKVQVENIKNLETYQALEREVPVFGGLFHLDSGEVEWIEKPE
ncbi:carbonic anhydrase [Alkalicoccus daliensis]|uniref:carbonic anhydrase n=1 Tax=Alkalicoccus daliensis TaxID=745820 RepID=A0A1H0DX07_9BACI|nr:carbonic anhydrase [Alkalicoccus daliensis]SDN74724.1 carbonic anhydrase [Alkalicoccus daliensis]